MNEAAPIRPEPVLLEKPLAIAILAMGGQGGGVLADWIVEVAEHEGWAAQSTSVPGVAQRTGATIYYIETLPPRNGASPVFSLMPTPGDVDVVLVAEAWTLERLAREADLSRTVFAERFSDYVGVSPLHYLTGWRLQLARRLLEQTGFGVARAAAEVRYESEAAFNRAFKKFVGVPPGAWRKSRLLSTEYKSPNPIEFRRRLAR